MANHPVCVLIIATIFAASAAKAQGPKEYNINPSSGTAGTTFDAIVLSESTCKEESPLRGMKILSIGDVTVKDQEARSGCFLEATIEISEFAPQGERFLLIVPQDGVADAGEIGFVKFRVLPIRGHPLPTLDPSVDLMWKILARKSVHDNFGRRVAKRYYSIEVMIGNNSGHDLQVAGVGFTMPHFKTKATHIVPSDSYKVVRGSLEREAEFGLRHFALGTIKTLGLLMTGLVLFLDTPLSDAPKVANFINSPVQEGFEVLFPRTTIAQLQRLEIQALHDGVIIPDGTQQRTLAFISKDMVGLESANRDDPQKVMASLGQLILVGHQVAYRERVQIVSEANHQNEGR